MIITLIAFVVPGKYQGIPALAAWNKSPDLIIAHKPLSGVRRRDAIRSCCFIILAVLQPQFPVNLHNSVYWYVPASYISLAHLNPASDSHTCNTNPEPSMCMGMFEIVDNETIRKGECTDIYFIRSMDVLKNEGKNPPVVMEVTASALPDPWAVICGIDDVINLLEGLPLSVDAMPEGTLFYANEPVLRITGNYCDFCRFETAILGFLCHASGIASAAAHMAIAASGRPVYSFGSRRQHPAIAAMIERSAWVGGVDGVSNTCSPAGIPVVGTMPHAFVMCYEKPEDAWRSFNSHAPAEVPRIMLCDTYCDEKSESLRAAECGASAVRLDTPRSRRGNMRAIIEEVRWELDAHDFTHVGIFLSGGVTREDIIMYRDIVDAFGVGGTIANAPVIDFGMDIVEIEGVPKAKRGKRSGAKQVWELPGGDHITLPAGKTPPDGAAPLLTRVIEGGQVLMRSDMEEARKRVKLHISRLSL